MTILLINGKPYTDDFTPIDYLTYIDMIEHGEIENMEVIDHD
jgi:hypothetical protein